MRDTGDGVVLKGIPRILACAVFCDEITGSCHNKNDDANDQSREKSHLNMSLRNMKYLLLYEIVW